MTCRSRLTGTQKASRILFCTCCRRPEPDTSAVSVCCSPGMPCLADARLILSRLKLMHELWPFEFTASDARGLMLSFSAHAHTSAAYISWLRAVPVATYHPNVSPAACRFKLSNSSLLLQVLTLLQLFAYTLLPHCQAIASGCGCCSLLNQGVDRGQDLTRACMHNSLWICCSTMQTCLNKFMKHLEHT